MVSGRYSLPPELASLMYSWLGRMSSTSGSCVDLMRVYTARVSERIDAVRGTQKFNQVGTPATPEKSDARDLLCRGKGTGVPAASPPVDAVSSLSTSGPKGPPATEAKCTHLIECEPPRAR